VPSAGKAWRSSHVPGRWRDVKTSAVHSFWWVCTRVCVVYLHVSAAYLYGLYQECSHSGNIEKAGILDFPLSSWVDPKKTVVVWVLGEEMGKESEVDHQPYCHLIMIVTDTLKPWRYVSRRKLNKWTTLALEKIYRKTPIKAPKKPTCNDTVTAPSPYFTKHS
jgi:hypothetical protein